MTTNQDATVGETDNILVEVVLISGSNVRSTGGLVGGEILGMYKTISNYSNFQLPSHGGLTEERLKRAKQIITKNSPVG